MVRRLLAAVAVLALGGLSAAQAAHPHAATLKKQANKWLAENHTVGAGHPFVVNVGRGIGEILDDGRNFTLIVGSELTRSGKPMIAASWGDKVFSFELTEEQQRKLEVEPNRASLRQGSVVRAGSRTPAPVRVKSLELNGGDRIDGDKKLTGRVGVETKRPVAGKLAVRISYSNGRTTTSRMVLVKELPEDGTVSFSFKAINDGEDDKTSGPTVIFCDVVAIDEAGGDLKVETVSSPVAVLVDVE